MLFSAIICYITEILFKFSFYFLDIFELDKILNKPKISELNVPTPSASYFPALTGLRAIAAYLVFIHHFNPYTSFQHESNTIGYWAYSVCNELYVGVTIFFCLSGFLIAHRYITRVELSAKWFFFYFRNRIARIYPLYFLLTVIIFLICYLNPQSEFIGPYNIFISTREVFLMFFLNVTFLRGYSDIIKFTGIAQGWSLTVEETFYLIAPLILWWVKGRKARLSIILIVFIMVGFVLVKIFALIPVLGVMRSNTFMLSYTFFGRCFEFISGIFLAMKMNSLQILKNKAPYTYIGLILMCVSIVLLCLARGSHEFGISTYKGISVNNIFLAIATAIFLCGLIVERSVIQRILSLQFVQLLGKSSYAFYLIHVGVVDLWFEKSFSLSYLGKFIVLNIAALALYKFVEEPVNSFIRNRLNYIPA